MPLVEVESAYDAAYVVEQQSGDTAETFFRHLASTSHQNTCLVVSVEPLADLAMTELAFI